MKSVSRVINREPNVSVKLQAKVDGAIAALGYVPDFAARSLAGGRSFTIGILYDNPSPNYTMKLQSGAYRACRANGYHLLIDHVATDRADVAEQLAAVLHNSRIDGLILTPPICDTATILDMLDERELPYVRIAPASFPGRSPSVAIDDEAAARELASHLIGLGHINFGIVNGPAAHRAAQDRRNGFIDVLTIHGCAPPAEVYGGFEFETGMQAGLELMKRADRPTAIFAGNDDSAAGVMAAASQLGLKVPQDVSIVGFDNSWVALSVWPPLTTINQPIAEIAEVAAQMLIDRNGAMTDARDLLLDYHLVARGSSAPPPPA